MSLQKPENLLLKWSYVIEDWSTVIYLFIYLYPAPATVLSDDLKSLIGSQTVTTQVLKKAGRPLERLVSHENCRFKKHMKHEQEQLVLKKQMQMQSTIMLSRKPLEACRMQWPLSTNIWKKLGMRLQSLRLINDPSQTSSFYLVFLQALLIFLENTNGWAVVLLYAMSTWWLTLVKLVYSDDTHF